MSNWSTICPQSSFLASSFMTVSNWSMEGEIEWYNGHPPNYGWVQLNKSPYLYRGSRLLWNNQNFTYILYIFLRSQQRSYHSNMSPLCASFRHSSFWTKKWSASWKLKLQHNDFCHDLKSMTIFHGTPLPLFCTSVTKTTGLNGQPKQSSLFNCIKPPTGFCTSHSTILHSFCTFLILVAHIIAIALFRCYLHP